LNEEQVLKLMDRAEAWIAQERIASVHGWLGPRWFV
jgi:hypothetical protein